MKSVFKQVVAVLVAVKALFMAIGEAMEFQAAQNRGAALPTTERGASQIASLTYVMPEAEAGCLWVRSRKENAMSKRPNTIE